MFRMLVVAALCSFAIHAKANPTDSRADRLDACSKRAEKEGIQRKDMPEFMKSCGLRDGTRQRFAPKGESSDEILERLKTQAVTPKGS